MTGAPVAEPLALRALLDEALGQARRHFAAVYWPVAVPLAALAALIPIAQGLWFRSLAGMSEPGAQPAAVFGGFFVMVGLSFFFFALYGLGYAALLAGAVDALAGRPVSMARAWGLVFRPRVLGTLLVAWLAFGAGLVLCILPGLYVGLLLCLVVPVMAEEGRFGTRAFARSSELVSYNPQRDWGADPRVKAFLVLFVGFLLAYALSFVVQLPLIVVQQVTMFRGVAAGQPVDPAQLMARLTWLQVPTSFLGTLVQTAVHLYVSFGLALLFFDVRRRKEGTDLETAVARLAERAPRGPAA